MRAFLAFLCLSIATALHGDIAAISSQNCVVHIESPQYDHLARQSGLQGEVLIEVDVAEDGHVRDERVISGHPLLAKGAENNIKLWIFAAGVARSLKVTYEFRLEGPAVDQGPPPRILFDLPSKVKVISKSKPVDP